MREIKVLENISKSVSHRGVVRNEGSSKQRSFILGNRELFESEEESKKGVRARKLFFFTMV